MRCIVTRSIIRRVTPSELDHIAQGGGLVDGGRPDSTRTSLRWADLKHPFCYRKLWGVYLGQFCMGGIFIFFLTWFPTYLVDYRGFDYKKSGLLAAIPFLAACAGVLLSGACSDFLKRRGFSGSVARKLPVIVGLLLSASIVGANYTDSTVWMMFFLSLAFFGNGLASIAWVFVSEIAPKDLLGLVGGVFNFVGNLAAVIVPVVIGFLISGEEGDFQTGLGFCRHPGADRRIQLHGGGREGRANCLARHEAVEKCYENHRRSRPILSISAWAASWW